MYVLTSVVLGIHDHRGEISTSGRLEKGQNQMVYQLEMRREVYISVKLPVRDERKTNIESKLKFYVFLLSLWKRDSGLRNSSSAYQLERTLHRKSSYEEKKEKDDISI